MLYRSSEPQATTATYAMVQRSVVKRQTSGDMQANFAPQQPRLKTGQAMQDHARTGPTNQSFTHRIPYPAIKPGRPDVGLAEVDHVSSRWQVASVISRQASHESVIENLSKPIFWTKLREQCKRQTSGLTNQQQRIVYILLSLHVRRQ